MLEHFLDNKITIGIIGLGYVGLPLAVLFSKKYDVIGFDLNKFKIGQYKDGVDVTGELSENSLVDSNISFTCNPEDLSHANFIVVAVPTPINDDKSPDLSFVTSATHLLSENLSEGSVIVYESTVFPGVTEDICIPIIEEVTGFVCGNEFSVGYSPERINPGAGGKSVADIMKIVSGYDEVTLDIVSEVYDSVLNKGVYKASSIMVAEAAKVTENIQRDVNIALMNELSIIFNNIGIDTNDVIDAAGTKWNFSKYRPGLVGGHCIGVDPYYLIYKSKKLNYSPRLIQTSRVVNEDIISHIVKNFLLTLIDNDVNVKGADVLVLGITFKENCNDIRNSKIVNVINELKNISVNLTIYDPWANQDEVESEYSLSLEKDWRGKFDAIILAVAHDEFQDLSYDDIKSLSKNKPILFDLKSLLKDLSNEDLIYWSL